MTGTDPAGAAANLHEARAAAERAARHARVDLCALNDTAAHAALFELFDEIWNLDPRNPPVTTEVLRALTHTGNYVVGSYDGRRLVGASVAFFAEPSRSTLYSHMTGVAGDARGRGVGMALKLHQRAWAIERGIHKIEWVFDPLVRRNAYLNLVKLAARATDYLVDFYGNIHDDVNEGQGSDRLVTAWDMRTAPVHDAGRNGDCGPRLPDLIHRGAVVLLDRDSADRPRATPRSGPLPPLALVRIPEDIERMRAHAADLAAEWRRVSREVLGAALRDGAEVSGFVRSGWYVVESRGHEG
jgi:predicted GNAT superfamily acetyltransferase